MVQLVKMSSNRFLHQLCLYAGIISVVMLGAECATYGESCDANNLCTDMSLYCSGTCGCTSGYNYQGSGDTCQPLIEYINPGYRFKTSSKFPTNMENSDLTELRQETLRSDLGPQLEKLFHNVTGFVEVSFGAISIPTNNVLEIEYTVVIDSQDPAFTGKTRDEVHDLLLNDLSQVAPKYNESIILDTSRHEYKGDDTVDDTSIAIGVGVGVGGLVIILVIVALAMFLCKRRSKQAAPVTKKEPAVKSPGTISSNCSTSGRSTQLDADDYKYSVFLKDGLSFPPHYATKVPASSSTGSVYAVVDDTNPLYQN